MLKLKSVIAAVAFGMCLSMGTAAEAAPSKNDAMLAIAVLEKNASSPEAAEAAKTIVVFAQVSDDVMVDIGPEQLPWLYEDWGLGKEKDQSLKSILLAAFVAGDVKSQIKSEKAEDDTYSGWIFAIDTYNRLRSKEHFISPAIDSLAKMKSEGSLLQHAREVRAKEEQEDQSDEQRKPLA